MTTNNNNDSNAQQKQVSLKDVLAAHPAEDPSETKLLRTLEEGANALPVVTNTNGQEPPGAMNRDVSRSVRKNSVAVEDELAQLASDTTAGTEDHITTMHGLSKRVLKNKDTTSFESDAARLMKQAAKRRKETSGVKENDSRKKKGDEYENEVMPDFDENKHDLVLMHEFKTFMAFRKNSAIATLKALTLYSLLPFLGTAAILYYFVPSTVDVEDTDRATVSWWIMFIGVRQVCTFLLARLAEDIFIDFLAVQTRVALNIIGPFFTLMLVQAKGWTFQLFMWAVIDFLILFGDNRFARHWLFFLEDYVELFSKKNSSGKVIYSSTYDNVLLTCLFVSAAIALKRFFLGLWYGQSVYRRYGKDLAEVMKRALLIQQVATLAYDKQGLYLGRCIKLDRDMRVDADDKSNSILDSETSFCPSSSKFIIDTSSKEQFAGGGLNISQKLKVSDLLGEWEEPVSDRRKDEEKASISAVVNFRAALSVIDREYPFSGLFGRAGTREECIDSSQRLFVRLEEADGEKDGLLKFDLLAAVALNKSGALDEEKLKGLISLFRPTRKGELSMLDFVKSVDSVYKELRVLQASVDNVRRMNAASQEIFDSIYHFIVVVIAMGILGLDPIALIAGISAIIVGLAFMIGGATSNWFEGMLFILIRKPYDIGDRIAVSSPDNEVSVGGSSGWIVKDVNLYFTTVIFGTTMEEATYSNFSLSDLRVINHNRSPKAFLNFAVRVGIATPKEKIQKFAEGVKDYVKARPREWLAFNAFRLSDVRVDQGFAEYKILIQHRESWQQIVAILNSKADVQMFAYELSKELGMEYESPPRPILFRNQTEAFKQLEEEGALQAVGVRNRASSKKIGSAVGTHK